MILLATADDITAASTSSVSVINASSNSRPAFSGTVGNACPNQAIPVARSDRKNPARQPQRAATMTTGMTYGKMLLTGMFNNKLRISRHDKYTIAIIPVLYLQDCFINSFLFTCTNKNPEAKLIRWINLFTNKLPIHSSIKLK